MVLDVDSVDLSNEFPNIDYQLFVELNGKIDFLVLVRVSDVEWLNDEQIKAICDRAWSLPIEYDKQRIGVIMVTRRGIIYRDGTSYSEDAQVAVLNL